MRIESAYRVFGVQGPSILDTHYSIDLFFLDRYLYARVLGEEAGDLAGFGVALGGFLAVDEGVADDYFKTSAAGGDQGQVGDGRGEFL